MTRFNRVVRNLNGVLPGREPRIFTATWSSSNYMVVDGDDGMQISLCRKRPYALLGTACFDEPTAMAVRLAISKRRDCSPDEQEAMIDKEIAAIIGGTRELSHPKPLEMISSNFSSSMGRRPRVAECREWSVHVDGLDLTGNSSAGVAVILDIICRFDLVAAEAIRLAGECGVGARSVLLLKWSEDEKSLPEIVNHNAIR